MIIDFDNKSNDLYYSLAFIVYFIITEYLPDFFALDHSFMTTYMLGDKNSSTEEEIVTVY